MASSTNSRVRSSGLRAVTDVIATPFPPSPGWPARLPLAAAALSAVGGIRLAVSELTGLLRGQATIGTVTSPNVDLPGILAEFRRRHPLVEITLSEESTSDLLDGVRSGRLDGVIASVGTTPPPGVELQVIVDQPVVAAVSHDHELSGTAVIPVSGLRGRPLISLPPGTGLRARLEEACAAAGFRPLIAFETRAPEMVAELAAHGLGTAILPGPFAEFRADRLAIVRIDPELRGRLVLAWRAGGPASPAGRALISLSRQALAARDR